HGVLYQVLTTEPRPLRRVAPSIPAALERVVAKAMNKVPHERYESAGQMMSMLQQIRAALSGADEEATQPLGRWTPLPRPMLKLITHASMRARLAVLGALAAVVMLLLYAPGQPIEERGPAVAAIPPAPTHPVGGGASGPDGAGGAGGLAAPPPPIRNAAPVSLAVSSRRDSALAARERANAAGAPKNRVPSLLLDDLGRALASQRIANLRVLYPGLTEEERRSWEAFFREWNQITAKFTMEDFKTQGASATGNVRALFQYVPAKGGAPRIDRRRFAMRFEKKDVGWRLAAVTELK